MLSGTLWTIIAILVVLWLIGVVVVHTSSWLIHILLVFAVIVLVYNLVMGSRARRML